MKTTMQPKIILQSLQKLLLDKTNGRLEGNSCPLVPCSYCCCSSPIIISIYPTDRALDRLRNPNSNFGMPVVWWVMLDKYNLSTSWLPRIWNGWMAQADVLYNRYKAVVISGSQNTLQMESVTWSSFYRWGSPGKERWSDLGKWSGSHPGLCTPIPRDHKPILPCISKTN